MKNQLPLAGLVLSLGLAATSAAFAQAPPPAVEVSIGKVALTTVPAKDGAKLTVTSPAFKDGADFPFENTQYRGNKFPGLNWSKGPASTKSYVVIMQDTDVNAGGTMTPLLHWTMYNIPAATTSLPAGMTDAPFGAYGPNMRGASSPFVGPKTPAGPRHRYHLQVFALDTTITPAPANDDALTAAMKDHVVASGQLIGLGVVDPTAPPPAPPAAK